MLEVKGIKKRFGEVVAVDGVDLRVSRGEMVGLLGPNGAGKTTTVSMIAGLLRPDGGEVLIGSRPLSGDRDPAKREIGLVPQELALYEELSARENLALFGALYGLDGAEGRRAIAGALEFVGLADRSKDKVAVYSGGMRRRLNLAVALVHDPKLLLLDEPTVGVDPQSRHAIFDNLETLKQRGKALLYTTHYMEEAERLCDRLVIIDHGKVVADDTMHGLYRLLPAANLLTVELEDTEDTLWLGDLRRLPEVQSIECDGAEVRIGVRSLSAETPRILQWLLDHGHKYRHVASERADLETVFLTLTGRRLRD